MIPRYSHALTTELWSPEWTYGTWLLIEKETLASQRRHGLVPEREALELLTWLARVHIDADAVAAIQHIERTTKHDVAAFLEWLRRGAPHGRFLHFGLTSSDVVDTALAYRFHVLQPQLVSRLANLRSELTGWAVSDQSVVGRTHGQPAEPTTLGARAEHWLAMVATPAAGMLMSIKDVCRVKLSGPVGTFAHNPPIVEAEVARSLGMIPLGKGASQVAPRSGLALWASAAAVFAAACAKIANDLRLMNLMGEVHWPQAKGQIGSSSMAHKNNPIMAEHIKGLAQLIQGYAAMLQPLDLWLERDISHSSVERVAVPDLWHILFRMIDQTTGLLNLAGLRRPILEMELEERFNQLLVHRTTLDAIRDGMDVVAARAYAMEFDHESYDPQEDARWFMRNYPST